MSFVSTYDTVAPSFDRHRALPQDVTEAIRTAILDKLEALRPHLLDIGAGTGRIGSRFVAAGDDYVGVDLSFGMLGEFPRGIGKYTPRLVQADGQRLPFRDATFDAVILIQIFGGMRGWRRLITEARRVLRSTGALVTGRSVAPENGVDAQMKQHLALLLGEMDLKPDVTNARQDVHQWLEKAAPDSAHVIAAAWDAKRTPRGFLDRHRTGARFSTLPAKVQDHALRELSAWAKARFGSLDAVSCERHVFELRIYKFP
jgi:ubiquinone/menaquinone biosynthesis C-methylase UbiE